MARSQDGEMSPRAPTLRPTTFVHSFSVGMSRLRNPSIVQTVRAANSIQIDFAGTPGAIYYVQATSNLSPPISWQDISTNVASVTSGYWSYTQPTTALSRRFFRASQKP